MYVDDFFYACVRDCSFVTTIIRICGGTKFWELYQRSPVSIRNLFQSYRTSSSDQECQMDHILQYVICQSLQTSSITCCFYCQNPLCCQRLVKFMPALCFLVRQILHNIGTVPIYAYFSAISWAAFEAISNLLMWCVSCDAKLCLKRCGVYREHCWFRRCTWIVWWVGAGWFIHCFYPYVFHLLCKWHDCFDQICFHLSEENHIAVSQRTPLPSENMSSMLLTLRTPSNLPPPISQDVTNWWFSDQDMNRHGEPCFLIGHYLAPTHIKFLLTCQMTSNFFLFRLIPCCRTAHFDWFEKIPRIKAAWWRKPGLDQRHGWLEGEFVWKLYHAAAETQFLWQVMTEVPAVKSLLEQTSPALLAGSTKRGSTSPEERFSAEIQNENRYTFEWPFFFLHAFTMFLEALVRHLRSLLDLVLCLP